MDHQSGRSNYERDVGTAIVASVRASFELGEPVWVMEAGGAPRRAEFMGARIVNVWRSGPPMAFVLYTDSRTVEAVEMDRIISRHTTA